ncbi:MAG: hypothetical protein LUD72_07095 [Bacteroidales bacterium]|nr:hypothetical protein [Bacteroidales bacterium]
MLGYFRNRRLKKDASEVQTGFLPLAEIRSAVVVVDGAAEKVEACVEQVERFCGENKIALRLMYIDLRKYNSKTQPPTELGKTLVRRDLNWYGRPNPLRVAQVLSAPADLYVCLCAGGEYCVRYISAAVQARFKVGPGEYEGDPFNMVVSPVGSSEAGSEVGFSSGSASASVDLEALFLKIRDLLVSVR